jgi:DNA-binding transcriptional MerR regulator
VPDSSVPRSAAAGGADVGLGVAAVARRIGVAPGTLRTWARRYGIGPTGHEAGTQRRYTSGDLSRLGTMRRLMLEGVSAADAARAALESPDGLERPGRRGLRRRDRPGEPEARPSMRGRPAGGGRVVPLRDASPAARGLARAAMTLDPVACAALLSGSLARRGVVETWQEMVLPVLVGVGERWRASGRGVEVEHLLCECVEDELRAVTRGLAEPRNVPAVLLAALAPEEHALPLHALAAALAERRVGVRMFGGGVPVGALADAMTRTGPAVVFLWAQGVHGLLDPARLDGLPELRPRPLLALGGAGWRAPDPEHAALAVRQVDDLPSAVQVVMSGLGLDEVAAR